MGLSSIRYLGPKSPASNIFYIERVLGQCLELDDEQALELPCVMVIQVKERSSLFGHAVCLCLNGFDCFIFNNMAKLIRQMFLDFESNIIPMTPVV